MSEDKFEDSALPHREEDELVGAGEEEKTDHRLDLYKRSPPLPDDGGRLLSEEERSYLFNDGEGLEYEGGLPLIVKFKRLHKNAVIPEKKTAGAAAADIYAIKDVVLQPGVTTLVELGFSVAIPKGYELVLVPRSSLPLKGVVVRNSPGTIDHDYRGPMGIILQYQPENLCQVITKAYKVLFQFAQNLVSQNTFDTARSRLMDHVKNDPFQPYTIKAGDRIGQLKLYKVINHVYAEVDELDKTERGDGGFGSTGR